jgi:putative transposase
MASGHIHDRGSVVMLEYHLVWIPRRRRKVLSGAVADRLEALPRDKAEELSIRVEHLAIRPDHLHMFVDASPSLALSQLVYRFEGYTSRVLRGEFDHLRRKAYRFRMRPTKAQEAALYRMAGARRFVYNWALDRRKRYYAEYGKGISARQLSSELTILKGEPDTLWLKDVDSQLLQQALRDVERAFDAFFEKRGRFPRFCSKKAGHFTFRIPQRVRTENGKVYVPKVGWVRIRQSREIEGKTKSATFKRDATGRWYVALTTEFDMPDVEPPTPENPVGVDLGIKDFFVLSDGERVPAPRFARKAIRKLRTASKNLSRKKPGSRRWQKAKHRVARVHRKVSDQRSDFLHKLTTDLTRKYDCICVEDLSTKGLAKTKLSRSVLDAAFGEFVRQVGYKATWNFERRAKVGRFFPSTKLCFECGTVNPNLTLSERTWLCGCGTQHDRDLNAARNVLAEGMRLLAAGQTDNPNARGGPVSLPTGSAAR